MASDGESLRLYQAVIDARSLLMEMTTRKEVDTTSIFLHRICCTKLFEAVQIHVQNMRFTCCLNMAFNLTKPNLSPELFAWESVGALIDHFADAFFLRNIACVFDIMGTQ